ncbi:DUF7109 family protein [Halorubrum trueperi]|uniref:Uncharacterized protein n=1 Tax=Halorubrum trueperi TaxID=2004704 RepID=A0ABD5UKH6_9EURY
MSSDDETPSVAARDDLAGVVDLFDWLSRDELSRALSELAFKQRAEVDEEAIAAAIDVAVAEYALAPAPPEALSEGGETPESGHERDTDGDALALAVGPAAFPSLPDDAADLPHILDIPERGVDREALSSAVLDRLSTDATRAIEAEDAARLETLADVTYDVEAWAPVDADGIRERIVDALDS